MDKFIVIFLSILFFGGIFFLMWCLLGAKHYDEPKERKSNESKNKQ